MRNTAALQSTLYTSDGITQLKCSEKTQIKSFQNLETAQYSFHPSLQKAAAGLHLNMFNLTLNTHLYQHVLNIPPPNYEIYIALTYSQEKPSTVVAGVTKKMSKSE